MTTILIVDDEAANRALLHAYLDGHGYDLVDATCGAEALSIAAARPVDLVLLDVMMPGADGFEVAQRLRALASESFLPIVLVSALTDQASRRRGLEVGADEFLSKPVDPQELLLRVRNLVSLREKERALLERNIEHLELRRFRDETMALVVHDLKNPLAALRVNLKYALETFPEDESLNALRDAEESGRRLSELIVNLADVQRLETARVPLRREHADAAGLMATVLGTRRSHARQREIELVLDCEPETELYVDRSMVLRVVENLLDNAFRYTAAGGRIAIAVTSRTGHTEVRVGNTGPSMPDHVRPSVFEKYASQSKGRGNLGLGLYFCRLAVEAHGGSIRVEETADLPTVFVLSLPDAEPRSDDGPPDQMG